MPRVEWAALEGGDVEAVLANLLYNTDDRAQRIRPAQGDFGIDVIIPATEAAEPWDVYQIKKFATNLTSGQKSQVVESFARLLIGLTREHLPVGDWYLVMPLDPTLPNLQDWFKGLPEDGIEFAKKLKKEPLTDAEEEEAREWLNAPGRRIEWKGLPFCETLAGNFPYVIDYYLHGGAERLRDAVDSVAGLLAGDMKARQASTSEPGTGTVALMEPSEVVATLTRLDEVLDTDPHYTYEHTVGPNRAEIEPEHNLVAAHQRNLPNGRWMTFKIYQRTAQSLEERPIPFKVEFKFEDGSPEQAAFSAWKRYGRPFDAPATFKVELPGGLGGEGDGQVSLAAPRLVSGFNLRMRVVDPEGTVLAEVPFEMTSTTAADGTGAWATGHDPSGALSHEGYYDVSPGASQTINFSLSPLAGMVAAAAHPAILFARHLEGPNSIQVAGPVGPFHELVKMDASEPLVPPAVERFIAALGVIQTRTSNVIHVPDIAELTMGERRQIQRAAELLEGGTRVRKWDGVEVDGVQPGTLEEGGHYQLQVEVPLKVTLDGVELELGGIEQTLLSAVVDRVESQRVRLVPSLNNTVHERYIDEADRGDAPDGQTTVRGRRYPELPASRSDREGEEAADS